MNNNSIWLHKKTGNIYVVHSCADSATNERVGDDGDVVYSRVNTDTLYTRSKDEFLSKFQDIGRHLEGCDGVAEGIVLVKAEGTD